MNCAQTGPNGILTDIITCSHKSHRSGCSCIVRRVGMLENSSCSMASADRLNRPRVRGILPPCFVQLALSGAPFVRRSSHGARLH